MSFLTKVFGGKKEDKAPTTGEAIQKLRETEEMLIKKQEFLEKKIEQELDVARKNGTKNKRGLCLEICIYRQYHLRYGRETRLAYASGPTWARLTIIQLFVFSLL